MKNNILNRLRSDYEEHEIKPSSELWDQLEQKLDEAPEIVPTIPFQWWKYAAVVLLLISLGIFIYNKNSFDYKKTDYIAKKKLEKTINQVNNDLQNESSIPNRLVEKKELKIAVENQKVNNNSFNLQKESQSVQPSISEFTAFKMTVKPTENITIQPAKIEIKNPHFPIIEEVKKENPVYISSNELLLGREFDKVRKNPYKKDIKFSIFHLDKAVPNIDNVTVLGVTVYVDPK
ncbi:hypothetical protein [Chryseobacterium gregarium]|uniref:hypothetical protein n=1 Tax=Chryseobacterium gregarium TaxID=456299 RepID=UPI000421648F|nr:hypothetical protein [Chryseobacterium gregarium]